MNIFFFILGNNILPIFLLIGAGYILSKKFDLDIKSLSKLNFYIFVPGFIFVSLYTTVIPFEMIKALIFAIIILFINMSVGTIIPKIRKYDPALTNAFKNSLMFYNSGNIGIPLITLVFSSGIYAINGETPYLNMAVTAQIMVMMVQNVSVNTIGFYNGGRATLHWTDSVKKILRMPTIYALPSAFIAKALPFDFTKMPGWPGLEYIRSGLISIALITLGVQLSKTKFNFSNKKVYLAVAIRLIGGPIIALGLILLMGFDGIIAQALMISSSVPTAVNTALIAVECDNAPDFASQTVMFATLFSAVTLTFVIFVSRLIFPVAL
ncbi:hypothetical protein EDC18_101290 [Natranaerovirga pectinivora]|uniref:AEC family transporter n=1 Tax=Natranaerovirga pectinivora TaxID=682400 RepID=A0A4R3MQC1_9FIRM|nr:AEC family transporter [Natranaerovirga pectinivora]TCT16994.1 hypothetical protein EDC18_101290 [Natranaerovirga pectinivora]